MAESSDVPQTSNHQKEENRNFEITTDSLVNIDYRATKSKNYSSKENYKRRHNNSYINNPNHHQQAYNTEFLNYDNNREHSQVSNNSGYINYNNRLGYVSDNNKKKSNRSNNNQSSYSYYGNYSRSNSYYKNNDLHQIENDHYNIELNHNCSDIQNQDNRNFVPTQQRKIKNVNYKDQTAKFRRNKASFEKLDIKDNLTEHKQGSESSNKRNNSKTNSKVPQKLNTKKNLTRSEILIDQIRKNKYECMVCCGIIRSDKSVWSCSVCFHMFHLYCIKKWAMSPSAKIEENIDPWRCPGCQTTHDIVPHKYTCFCGKQINPELNRGDGNKPIHLRQLPHSCGEICGRPLLQSSNFWKQESLSNPECKHKCLVSCHPGPCQPCDALVTRSCNCGKNKFQVKCSSTKIPICNIVCEKKLNCQLHTCTTICHSGECKLCDIDIKQICYSHQTERIVKCGFENLKSKCEISNDCESLYSCDHLCGKLLACGNHYCESLCHQGPCPECSLLPSKLVCCPCGKSKMKELLLKNKIIRTSCLDPVPVCEKKCGRKLHVNLEEEIHICQQQCHIGECEECKEEIKIKCRCGKDSSLVECFKSAELNFCNRRCTKKKTCGRHQCNEICCSDKSHLCTLICNRMLNCGIHKCDQLCHKSGQCQRCLVAKKH